MAAFLIVTSPSADDLFAMVTTGNCIPLGSTVELTVIAIVMASSTLDNWLLLLLLEAIVRADNVGAV